MITPKNPPKVGWNVAKANTPRQHGRLDALKLRILGPEAGEAKNCSLIGMYHSLLQVEMHAAHWTVARTAQRSHVLRLVPIYTKFWCIILSIRVYIYMCVCVHFRIAVQNRWASRRFGTCHSCLLFKAKLLSAVELAHLWSTSQCFKQ